MVAQIQSSNVPDLVLPDVAKLRKVLNANLGGEQLTAFSLDRISVPRAGGTTWTIASLEGEKEQKTFEAVIILWQPYRAWWEKAYDGSKTPPSCFSPDLRMGQGFPGGPCKKCEYSKWGSSQGGGAGSACRETRVLFLLQQGSYLPSVLRVPRTSLSNAREYYMRMASVGVEHYSVVTEFTLTKEKVGVAEVSVINFRKSRDLSASELAQVESYIQAISPILNEDIINDLGSGMNGEPGSETPSQ